MPHSDNKALTLTITRGKLLIYPKQVQFTLPNLLQQKIEENKGLDTFCTSQITLDVNIKKNSFCVSFKSTFQIKIIKVNF